MFDKAVLVHAEILELTQGGVMNEGFVSMRLGLRGMPAVAEEIMIYRDIVLAELTGGAVPHPARLDGRRRRSDPPGDREGHPRQRARRARTTSS